MQGSFHQVALVLFCTISALIDVGYNRHTSQVRAFVEAESNSATGPGKKLPLEWRRSPWVDGQLDPECGLWLGVSKCLGRLWTLPRPLAVRRGGRETCAADLEPPRPRPTSPSATNCRVLPTSMCEYEVVWTIVWSCCEVAVGRSTKGAPWVKL